MTIFIFIVVILVLAFLMAFLVNFRKSLNDPIVKESSNLLMSKKTYLECQKAFELQQDYISKGLVVPENTFPSDRNAYNRYVKRQNEILNNIIKSEPIADCSQIVNAGKRLAPIWKKQETMYKMEIIPYAVSIHETPNSEEFIEFCVETLSAYFLWNGGNKETTQKFFDWAYNSKMDSEIIDLDATLGQTIEKAEKKFKSYVSGLEKELSFAMNEFEEIAFKAYFFYLVNELGNDIINANPQIKEDFHKAMNSI